MSKSALLVRLRVGIRTKYKVTPLTAGKPTMLEGGDG